MVSQMGTKRVLCDPRTWAGVRGDTRAEQVAYASLGAYKRLSDVPYKHRLARFVGEYANRPLMDEFIDGYKPHAAASYRQRKFHRVRRAVENHITEGHYAFLTPQQADEFFGTIANQTVPSQYETYLSALRTMYEWLIFHHDYPHRYNPLDMAILHHGAIHDLIEDWLDHEHITVHDNE